ncbi:hypothetical protein J2X65_002079 [Ancylobacter sp. 3268]|uniref:hypothetical protein n=1 Tax=Ancylobacter sp. 3268 TaxID=2817752 RepID=UPI00285B0D02|nr:hypothetical protein [Ancylobacter sp. 3268]MDR6952720.1 hypothetical protein [Ancylobacter sp. 3268]
MSNVFDLFVLSARERRPIACIYDGHARQLCVHVVGYRHGKPKALAFQFAGGSASGLPPGGEWRCLFLDRVGAARIVDGGWHSARHSQPQTCIDRVVVQVRD